MRAWGPAESRCDRSQVSEIELLTVGRVNLDLYAQQVTVPFEDVGGWDAMVGGSPTNVALAATRLGVRAGVFTAVGDDLVGDWVLRALEREGVETSLVRRKPGPHTSLALRAQEPPDHPLIFYRHDPADIYLTVAEAATLPLTDVQVVLVSADSLARGSTVDASRWILENARELDRTIHLDLDLRRVNWPDLATYATAVGPAAERADVVLGTIEEYSALLELEADAPENSVLDAIRDRLGNDPARLLIVKQGRKGATFQTGDQRFHIPAEAVREASTVGAGDSFAAGLIRARLNGAAWPEAGHIASACAAITVSRFGCSSGFPHLHELEPRIEAQVVMDGGR
jgi:5-dehydro-2-deoxygluconokinase